MPTYPSAQGGYAAPAGYSLDSNIAEARDYASSHSASETYIWFYGQVKGHGPWDYKQQGPYEELGNWNYGAVGAAIGIPDAVLQRLAGWAQRQSGTSLPEWGTPLGGYPYGDDPSDQTKIVSGIEWAKNNYSNPSPLLPGYPISLGPADISVYRSGVPSIDIIVNATFTAARNLVIRYDPLVLDLDGDGLELAGATGAILFDHNADGIKTGTGWVHPDDGLLVRDVNGNGVIDTGRELFGVDTIKSNGTLATNGFDALKDLDSDGDGFITGADAAFGELRVWQDANQDGISQAGEIKTLAALSITSIGVSGSASGPPAGQVINGNRVALSATFTRDGQTRAVGSVDLEANNFFTEFPAEVVDADGNPVAITEQAQALPQMNGSGMVRDMQTAASLSSTFADALEAFAATATRDGQRSQLDNLIAQWAATSGYWGGLLADSNAGNVTLNPPAGTTAAQYRNMINVLEAFNGSRFYGNEYGGPRPAGFTITSTVDRATGKTLYRYIVSPPAQQVALVQQAYDALKESVYVALVTQTRLKPYLDSIELTIDENGIGFDTSALAAKLESYKAVDAKEALTDLVELNRYALPTLQAVHFDGLDTLRTWVDSLAADSPLRATLASLDVLTAGVTTGTARGDIYLGGAGADSFNGGAGDDVLIGGAGNDVLNGGIGNNVYVFGRGDGQDTISGTYDTAANKSSLLQFRADVAGGATCGKRTCKARCGSRCLDRPGTPTRDRRGAAICFMARLSHIRLAAWGFRRPSLTNP